MSNKTIEIKRFDVAEILTDDATIESFLNETLLEETPSEFVHSLNDVARAKEMNTIAQGGEIGQKNCYKPLKSASPSFETLVKKLDSLGLQLQVVSKLPCSA